MARMAMEVVKATQQSRNADGSDAAQSGRHLPVWVASPSPRLLIALTALTWWLAGAFQIAPLGWLALVPFFVLVHDLPVRARLRLGYWCGFWSFALINWWLIPTITRGAPAIGAPVFLGFGLSLLAVVLIGLIHAWQLGFVALFARGNSLWSPLVLAAVWTLLDWLRCQGPIAHSWGALAFTQTSDTVVLSWGQHLLTFWCVLVAVLVAMAWRRRSLAPLGAACGVLVFFHAVALARFAFAPLPSPSAPRLRVLVVQTSVSSLRKSGAGAGLSPFQQAFEMTRRATQGQKFDLVLWPETTAEFQKLPDGSYGGSDWAQWRLLGPRVPLLAGASTTDAQGRRFNEAVLINSGGVTQSYAKRRLVPFGERAPLVEYLPFLQIFSPPPMVEPGAKADPFWLALGGSPRSPTPSMPAQVAVLPQICFESCFPMSWARLAQNRFGFEAVLTNDEWFAGTEASRQHRAMAQLRAAEAGRPLVQSCNGTYSCLIDAWGRIVATTTSDAPQTLDVSLAAR